MSDHDAIDEPPDHDPLGRAVAALIDVLDEEGFTVERYEIEAAAMWISGRRTAALPDDATESITMEQVVEGWLDDDQACRAGLKAFIGWARGL